MESTISVNVTKFNKKYRIESARMQNWDYANEGAYFITICTKDRVQYFGEIVNGEMQLNELGNIVQTEWIRTLQLRPDMNLELGEFVVMPNHFHAIIIIGENKYNGHGDGDRRDAMHRVSTIQTTASTGTTESQNHFGPQSKNLASIVRGFKSSVTTKARKMVNVDFAWQSRYHDHIIRNSVSFENIQQYIITNPQKWLDDLFNPLKNPDAIK